MSNQEIEAKHRKTMNDVAELMDNIFTGYGFALLVFPFNGTDGRMNYISNARRDDMLAAMREFIAANEGRVHDAPVTKQ